MFDVHMPTCEGSLISGRHVCRCSLRVLFLYVVTWHESVLIRGTSHSHGVHVTCEYRLIDMFLRYIVKSKISLRQTKPQKAYGNKMASGGSAKSHFIMDPVISVLSS